MRVATNIDIMAKMATNLDCSPVRVRSIYKMKDCHDAKSHAQKPCQGINITLSRRQHTNQNRLKLSVASHTHSALTALKELKCLYRNTPHFSFI